jgi:hypothetical protein
MTECLRILFYSTCSLVNYDDADLDIIVKLKSIVIEEADLEDRAMIFFCTTEGFEVPNSCETMCPTRKTLYKFFLRKYPQLFSEKQWSERTIPDELMEHSNNSDITTHFDMIDPELKQGGLDRLMKIDRRRFDVLVKAPYLDDPSGNLYPYHLEKWKKQTNTPKEFKEFLVNYNTKRMCYSLLNQVEKIVVSKDIKCLCDDSTED